ncbi:MAG: aldo/keto reductase [Ruminococcus sp.]|nr:aldo/keto reductase [Ruminococcus sp.]
MRLPLLDGSDQKSFDKEQLCKMVDTFLERGFTYFDTAYMYHEGYSERVIKEVLVERHKRDEYTLATKLPTMMLKEANDMERIFNEQLDRTGVDYFDYYLLHCLNKDNYATSERLGAFEFVSDKKAQGKVKCMGFSFHDTPELLDQILTEHPETEFVQLQINYLDWESESVQSRRCYEIARKHGKKIVIMEPVKGGALANVPPKAEKLLKDSLPNMSVSSWAIRFAAGLDDVMTVLSGMSNKQQLLDNTDYMQDFKPLSESEIQKCMMVADIINDMNNVPCTACRYCVEGCPMNIAIPEYFAMYNSAKKESWGIDKQKKDYSELNNTRGKASDCVECGQCEEHCPQHINIIERLKVVAETLE